MTRTLRAIAAAAALTVALGAAPAIAQEAGVTFFENGSCTEADGTPGMARFDGTCTTAAEYDELFSVENLSTVPSALNPDISIAEEAGLVDDGVVASEKPRGVGLVEEPITFAEDVERLYVYSFNGAAWPV